MGRLSISFCVTCTVRVKLVNSKIFNDTFKDFFPSISIWEIFSLRSVDCPDMDGPTASLSNFTGLCSLDVVKSLAIPLVARCFKLSDLCSELIVKSIRVFSTNLFLHDSVHGTRRSTGIKSLLVDAPSPVHNILSNEDCSATVNSPISHDNDPSFELITSNGFSLFTNSTNNPRPTYATCIRHFYSKSA